MTLHGKFAKEYWGHWNKYISTVHTKKSFFKIKKFKSNDAIKVKMSRTSKMFTYF